MNFNVNLNIIYGLLGMIENEIIKLADITRNRLFPDKNAESLFDMLPIWIVEAGHSQECALSKEMFKQLVQKFNKPEVNKLLYYYDCDALLFGLQNRFSSINILIEEVYKQLSRHINIDTNTINAGKLSDSTSIHTHACMNSIFINLASSCDILTKVAFELEFMKEVDFSTYPKMRSANITFGNKNRLPLNLRKDNTYFAEVRPISIAIVETLRDEIIHNGSLDFNYYVYSALVDEKIYDWILCPDFTKSGTFTTYNGRKKFYGDGDKTFNEELPKIVENMLTLANNTLKLLNNNYYDNK